MRLNCDQISVIHANVHQALGAEAAVFVYGSRTDDTRRGGDLDLLVEVPYAVDALQRAALKLRLGSALNLPVDLLVSNPSRPSTFARIARAHALPLNSSAT